MIPSPGQRWWVAAVLVAASVLNYIDRVALGVASKRITDELGMTDGQYATVVNAFLIAYTLSYALGGILVDRLGTRRSVVLSLAGWSLANMAHALAHTQQDLALCRFALGLGEAMFFPAAMRAISEWFEPAERSRPIGLILAGASLGAVLATPIVGLMMAHPAIGWRGAFVLTGGLGFLVLPVWLAITRGGVTAPYASARGRALPWSVPRVLGHRQAWVLMVTRFLTDAAWYLLLFWLIRYFQKERGFTDLMVAQRNWIPYATADLGAILGGWLAAAAIQRGWSTGRTRKVLMTAFAALLPFSLLGYWMPAEFPFVALAAFSVATFGHMAYGANSLSLHADLYPPHAVATMMGISGAAGSLGGVVAGAVIGPLVDSTHTYLPVFVTTAVLHPLAAVILLTCLGHVRQLDGDQGQRADPPCTAGAGPPG